MYKTEKVYKIQWKKKDIQRKKNHKHVAIGTFIDNQHR